MNELRNSKSDDQLEELLLLTEQMQEELDQKDRTIRELKVQLDESLTLNEKLNSENKTENIQALKNDLRKTKELLQSEKEKTHTVQAMIEECRDKCKCQHTFVQKVENFFVQLPVLCFSLLSL